MNKRSPLGEEDKPQLALPRALGIRSRVSAACAFAVCADAFALYAYYLLSRRLGIMQIILSAASVVLFCVALLRAVPALERLWRVAGQREESLPPVLQKGETWRVAVAAAAFVLAFNLFLFLIALSRDRSLDLAESLDRLWRSLNIDASHYLDISKVGYVDSADDLRFNIVFFPLYPLTIRMLQAVSGLPNVLAAHLSSAAFAVSAAVLLYKLARLDSDRETAYRAVKYLMLFPVSFFLVAPMTESAFLFLSIAAFYAMRKRLWAPAALCAFFAALTRSTGIVLAAPLLVELIGQYRADKAEGKRLRGYSVRALAVFAPFAGLSMYLLINKSVYGDPFTFMDIQHTHWQQQITYFWNTPAYQIRYLSDYLREGNPAGAFSLMGAGLLAFFGALTFLALGARRLRVSYTVYALAYFAMTMGAEWLLSAPRYMLCLFPLYLVAARRAKNPLYDTVLTIVSGVAMGGMLHMLLMSYDVF